MNNNEFSNTEQKQWAIILGGSSGLGLASAIKLAGHGMNICIVYRAPKSQEPEIQERFDRIKVFGIDFLGLNTDAMNPVKRKEVIDQLKNRLGNKGKIRTFLHSVAKGNLKPMHSDKSPTLKNDDFHLTIDSMAISLYDWVKALFLADLFAEDARVLGFTSEGSERAWKSYAAVSAAKAALESITRSIALEYAPFGIRANCIMAGVTDTESLRMIPGNEELKKHSIERNPFNRLTLPEDVANVVYLLSKNEASWINGEVIKVNGGEHLN